MNFPYAVLLGLLQGATEFLPISSSGHLALVEYFLGIKEAGLVFDIALHLGTLLGVLIYFRRDFIMMFTALVFPRKLGEEARDQRLLLLHICLGTIPAVAAGRRCRIDFQVTFAYLRYFGWRWGIAASGG